MPDTRTPRRRTLEDFDLILVDVGNVLLYDFPVEMAFTYALGRELARAVPGLELRPDELLWAVRTAAPVVPSPHIEIWRAAVAVAGARILELWHDLSVPIPGARDALARLGRRRAIVANQPPPALDVLRALGVDALVEEIFLDSMVGLSKPDPGFFRHAAQSLGADPQRTIMIGDRLDNDIVPAQSAGMAVGWIHRVPLDPELRVTGVPEAWRMEYLRTRPGVQARLDDRHRPTRAPDFAFAALADAAALCGRA